MTGSLLLVLSIELLQLIDDRGLGCHACPAIEEAYGEAVPLRGITGRAAAALVEGREGRHVETAAQLFNICLLCLL